jgi:hypothetical protein
MSLARIRDPADFRDHRGDKLPDNCFEEIERAIQFAAMSGETLFVAHAAKTIADQCGGLADEIAEALTQAGIKAGVTMQFGKPE